MTTETTIDIDREQAILRANVYRTLVDAFSPPDEWPTDFAEALAKGFFGTSGVLATSAGLFVAAADSATSRLEQVAVAHARLFVGPFDIEAAPWAALYLDPEKRLMGPASLYAADAFASAGLGPAAGPRDAPDHVLHELEFMYYLSFQEATAGGDEWRERQRRFWNEHLGRWLPDLARAVREADLDPYYNTLADLVLVFLRLEESLLAEEFAQPN